jgi:hypothetical protein
MGLTEEQKYIFDFIQEIYIKVSIILPLLMLFLLFYYKKYAPKKIFWIFASLLFYSAFADFLLDIRTFFGYGSFYCQIVKAVFSICYLETIIYFYYVISKTESNKSIYLKLFYLVLIIQLVTAGINYYFGEWLFRFLGIYESVLLYPITIFHLFQINETTTKNFKHHKDPIFIFNCAIFINLGFSILHSLFEYTLDYYYEFVYQISVLFMWAGWLIYYILIAYGISNYKRIYKY